jgi:hypothetical protein
MSMGFERSQYIAEFLTKEISLEGVILMDVV